MYEDVTAEPVPDAAGATVESAEDRAKRLDECDKLVRYVLAANARFWASQAENVKRAWHVYNVAMDSYVSDGRVQAKVSVPDGAASIDSFAGALFSQPISFVVGRPIHGTEASDSEVASTLLNSFTSRKDSRHEVFRGGLLALCFGLSAWKVEPAARRRQRRHRAAEAHVLRAYAPWSVLVDYDARVPSEQRWIGCRYNMTAAGLSKKFGIPMDRIEPYSTTLAAGAGAGSTMDFGGPGFGNLFGSIAGDGSIGGAYGMMGGNGVGVGLVELAKSHRQCEVVEIYDLVNDQVLYWSPNVSAENPGSVGVGGGGTDLYGLTRGALLKEPAQIPLRDDNDDPLVPIESLRFLSDPANPMVGISVLSRLEWAVLEKAFIRSAMQTATRRDVRIILARAGAFSSSADNEAQKLNNPTDGDVIYVDTAKDESPSDVVEMLELGPMSSNLERSHAMADQDIERAAPGGSILRGQPAGSRTTATEIELLGASTATQSNMLTTKRNDTLEAIANVFLRATLLGLKGSRKEDAEVVDVNAQVGDGTERKPRAVTHASLDGDFVLSVADGAATPQTKALQRAQWQFLGPILANLGGNKAAIRAAIVKAYDKDPSLAEGEPVQAPTPTPPPTPPGAGFGGGGAP